MKCLVSIILIFLAVIPAMGKTRLLTVTVADYAPESGWAHINANNDKEIVLQQFQSIASITSLSESQATYRNILKHLSTLERDVSKGDTVIVHFSGHGQQIVALNDSDEPDGLDEALIPFDAAKNKSAKYDGRNHLRDNEFGRHLGQLRCAVGPQGLVIAIIDACHSDSMNKDAASSDDDVVRGTYEIFGLTDDEFAAIRSRYRNQETAPLDESPDASPIVIVSACRSDQMNHEIKVDGKGYGSLTYYFIEAVKTTGLQNPTAFLDHLYRSMSADKTLRFHGQLPLVRNTLGWIAPEKEIITEPQPEGEESSGENISSKHNISWHYVLIGSVILILIIGLIWKRMKK